jgi:Ca-activated chloride channel family protein
VTGGADFFLGATRRADGNTESYDARAELGFTTTAASALSTFAADVDTAAYSNLRRFLAEGHLPPAEAIRVEEIVNAQGYRDPAPEGGEPFAITTELGRCPWQREHLLLRIGLRTRPIETAKVPPCNLVFLIDVSGSMNHPAKLPLVIRSMALLVGQLRPQDRIAIVTYASGVHEPLPAATGADQARILEVLTNLRAGGSTNGEGGIQRAYELARQHRVAEGCNRVLLATDCDFNVGISDADELEKFIAARKDDGVFLTVLGVGTGNLKDDRLERLADKGNGVYAYLDSLTEARRVLVEQFGASMMTVAKDVKLQLEFDPVQVAGWRQIGYENRQLTAQEFRDDQKDAGELGAGHAMTALYELTPAGGPKGPSPIATLRVRYKPPLANEARELSRQVASAVVERSSRDFRVATVAAALGMLLRNSPYAGTLGWDDLAAMAAEPGLDAPDLAGTVAAAHRLQPSPQAQK